MTSTWGLAWGQSPGPPPSPTPQLSSPLRSLYQVDRMIEQAADQVARRYNFKPEQDRFARNWLREAVIRLLGKHESALRSMVSDYVALRITGRTPSVEMAQRWAELAEPMLDDIFAEAQAGHAELRTRLDPKQQRLQDFEMDDNQRVYAQLKAKLARWKAGGFTQADWTGFQQGRMNEPGVEAGSATTRPADGALADTLVRSAVSPQARERAAVSGPERLWVIYVRNFVRDYQLDPAQIVSAQSVLEECLSRAATYRAGHAGELSRVDAVISAAIDDADRPLADEPPPVGSRGVDLTARAERRRQREHLAEAIRRRGELIAPIHALFDELKARLQTIVTPRQRAEFEQTTAERVAELNSARDALIRQGGVLATQPAD